MNDEREELVSVLYRGPNDIAVAIGYDKLTDLHNEWIKDMVFGEGDGASDGAAAADAVS